MAADLSDGVLMYMIERSSSDALQRALEVADEHLAKGMSLLDKWGTTTEQRRALYLCELIKRGKLDEGNTEVVQVPHVQAQR